MTGNRATVSVLALAGCLIGINGLAAAQAARAQPATPSGASPDANEQFDFDIPAQALAVALNQYAAVSDRPTLFASDMVLGRSSSRLRGRYTPEAALRILLEGSGLAAEKVDTDLGRIFLLQEQGAKPVGARPGPALADLLGAGGYPGLAQARIVQALCADRRTAPGRYSAVLRFRLDAAGRIQGARLLGSTGDAGRDAALLDILPRVQIDLLPPANLVQKALTMMVLPADAGAGRNGKPPCSPAGGQGAL